MGIGAAAGAVGGASSHIGSNASKVFTSGAAQAATRVGVQATAGMATDASLQMLEKGTIDPKQLLLNTAGQVTIATTGEITQSVSKQTTKYAEKVNSEMIDDNLKNNPDPDLKAKLEKAAREINSLKPEVVQEQNKLLSEYEVKEQNRHQERKNFKDYKADLVKAETVDPALKDKVVKHVDKRIKELSVKSAKPPIIGDNKNIHVLADGKLKGDFAVDLGTRKQPDRAVFTKHGKHFIYQDHTTSHDYNNMRTDVTNLIPDPFDALRPDQLRARQMENEEEQGDDKKTK